MIAFRFMFKQTTEVSLSAPGSRLKTQSVTLVLFLFVLRTDDCWGGQIDCCHCLVQFSCLARGGQCCISQSTDDVKWFVFIMVVENVLQC